MKEKKVSPRRILLIRTDRIGDVLLSTPLIKVLRQAFPFAYLAMMVRPYAEDIVLGNPYLDRIFLYDKYGLHKSIWGTARFIAKLRKERFDTAIVLHPTNRANWVAFLSRVPERVGYNRKCGFLLTAKLQDAKHKGLKHESEYILDVARAIGLDVDYGTRIQNSLPSLPRGDGVEVGRGATLPAGTNECQHVWQAGEMVSRREAGRWKLANLARDLFMPVRYDAEEKVEKFLNERGVTGKDLLVAMHPGASCPSKRWPPERFARAADRLMEEFGVKAILITGPDDPSLANMVGQMMRHKPIFGRRGATVAELASTLRRCRLCISNDSGPVHVATAVGTPVIAIFGRKQPGLSPVRWGPLGKDDIFLHKDVGCKDCLAHNCEIGFRCLWAISVEEVVDAARKFLW